MGTDLSMGPCAHVCMCVQVRCMGENGRGALSLMDSPHERGGIQKKFKILNKLDETGLRLATTNRKLNIYRFIL